MAKCEHDWRVNQRMQGLKGVPFDQLVCAKCRRKKMRMSPIQDSKDIKDWPQAQ